MKKIPVALAVTVVLALGIALAQTGSGGHNHGESDDHVGTMPHDQMSTMEGMAERHGRMMSAYDVLDQHFQDMMLVTDFRMLRDQMEEHYTLMRQMRDHMVVQERGWQQMMPATAHSRQMPHDTKAGGSGCGH